MAYLYFDESIRDSGEFIVGALVIAQENLSSTIHDHWREMGFDDPCAFEYKSSAPKFNDPQSRQQRSVLRELLHLSNLALTICPCIERKQLGIHCTSLVTQLQTTGLLTPGNHELYLDQNIFMPKEHIATLISSGVSVHLNQDSRITAGLQVADHAAHALGGMLLEEMQILRKVVLAGEGSGYDPDLEIELGFELWASLRYALLGHNEYIPGLSPPPDDPANPFFRVEGYGLFISPSCPEKLAEHARNCFGINYLGCIH